VEEDKVEPIELEPNSEPTAESKGDLSIPNLVQDQHIQRRQQKGSRIPYLLKEDV
jgi:hypothetical protein